MTTLTATSSANGEHFVFYDTDWSFYTELLRRVAGRRVFTTYDGRDIELLSPSWKHDNRGRLIGYLIRVMAEELNVPFKGGGSTTFRSELLERGFEPDECFYTTNYLQVRNLEEIDLSRDPPPDLAVEVEITRRLLDRVSIYEAVGIRELWRYDGQKLRVFVLSSDGRYQQRDRSPTFSAVPLDKLDWFLDQSASIDEATWGKNFRQWI